jgi:hypothetical protein
MALFPVQALTKELLYFCDESSFMVREDTMAVAGLAVPRTNIPKILKRISEIPNGGFRDEVKWQTTRAWNLESRMAYVDCLASLVKERLVHFHIRFAEFAAYSHDGPRKRFDTVSKMYYQLFLHRALRYYGSEYKLHIRPDDGECTSQLKLFMPQLAQHGCSHYGTNPDCIADLECLSSGREPILQLLDVTLGALTAYRNDRHLIPGAALPKTTLAKHAIDALAIKDIRKNFDDGRKLSVWNVIPRLRGPRG